MSTPYRAIAGVALFSVVATGCSKLPLAQQQLSPYQEYVQAQSVAAQNEAGVDKDTLWESAFFPPRPRDRSTIPLNNPMTYVPDRPERGTGNIEDPQLHNIAQSLTRDMFTFRAENYASAVCALAGLESPHIHADLTAELHQQCKTNAERAAGWIKLQQAKSTFEMPLLKSAFQGQSVVYRDTPEGTANRRYRGEVSVLDSSSALIDSVQIDDFSQTYAQQNGTWQLIGFQLVATFQSTGDSLSLGISPR